MKKYIGIDPGKSGAISMLDGSEIKWIKDMPLTNLCKRRTEDLTEIFRILSEESECNDDEYVIIIEQASHHYPSVKVVISSWFGYRAIIEACRMAELRYVEVTSKKWQSEFGITGKSNKEGQSIAVFKSLFPKFSLLRNPRCRVESHDWAESGLLAEYGRRKGL